MFSLAGFTRVLVLTVFGVMPDSQAAIAVLLLLDKLLSVV